MTSIQITRSFWPRRHEHARSRELNLIPNTGARKSGVSTWAGAESAIRSWARQLAARIEATKQR